MYMSKPLIYLSSISLIAITVILSITDKGYKDVLINSKIFKASIILFCIGVFLGSPSSHYFIEDSAWMAKKTMMLLLIAPLLIAFKKEENRRMAIIGIMCGFSLAFILTGHHNEWAWIGKRVEGGTWPVDTWGVICSLTIAFAIPVFLLKDFNFKFKILLLVLILASSMMLIASGARGAWIGVLSGIFIYLLFKNKKALLVLLFTLVAVNITMKHIFPVQYEFVKDRFQSITEIEEDESNFTRIALWETGLWQIKKDGSQLNAGFFLGRGHAGHVKKSTDFYQNEFQTIAIIKPGLLNDRPINDFHNMYIQSTIQNGIIWTFFSMAIIIWISFGPLEKNIGQPKNWLGLALLITYFTTGITYTLLPHFSFMFLIFIASLLRNINE